MVVVMWKLGSVNITNVGRYMPCEDTVALPERAIPVKLDVDEEVSTLYFMVPEHVAA